jgi:hypothetical protein
MLLDYNINKKETNIKKHWVVHILNIGHHTFKLFMYKLAHLLWRYFVLLILGTELTIMKVK